MSKSSTPQIMSKDLKERMGKSIGKIKTFNGLLVVLVLLLFSVFFMISLSIYFEFRSHLCTFSNVRKCVASDKFCATKKQIQNDKSFAVEYLTNQNIGINTDLTQVINQTVQVGYYNYDNTTNIIGTSVFNIDFNFTDSVPGGGVNDILSLGPSVGYHVNPSSGVSIYLYPFAGKTIDGVSVAQIDKVISEGMSASSDVAYIDEPLEGSKNQFNKAGVVFVSDVDDYQFKLGTYILMSYANANPKNLSLTSSQVGVSSLFTNFQKSDSIPYQEIVSNNFAVNITEIIKLNNYRSRQNCNDTNKTGCTCVDPAVRYLPNCNDYTYDPTTGIYTPHSGKKPSIGGGGSVRFCSYLANSGTGDSSQAIANNVPSAYSSFESQGKSVNYYRNGFAPGNSPVTDPTTFKKERYNLPSIFCSNVPSGTNFPTDYNPENNSLYQKRSTDSDYSDVGTSVWNSQNPNATLVGNLVNLGHPTN